MSKPSTAAGMKEHRFKNEIVKRYVLTSVPSKSGYPAPSVFEKFPKKDLILILGEAPGIKAFLAASLAEEGFCVRHIKWGNTSRQNGTNGFFVSPDESPAKLLGLICPAQGRVGAVINFAGFDPIRKKATGSFEEVLGLLHLLKLFEAHLKSSSKDGGGLVYNVTPMGGSFGWDPDAAFSPVPPACTGLAKTLALEWPEVRTRCIDMDMHLPQDLMGPRLWQEMNASEDAVEIGLNRDGRCSLTLEEKSVSDRTSHMPPNPVFLLIGGAYGITGEVAKALACYPGTNLILVGRSSPEEAEPEETCHMEDEKALRAFFIRTAGKGNLPATPFQINARIDHIMKQRQIRSNINKLQAAGARVRYHRLDVTDVPAFGALIDDIYERYGKIDGVVHGAGIIKDQLIRNKSAKTFSRVYQTKVIPADVLARKLRPSQLKFLVFFSSIAARFGNVGQSDYSAANEVLNKQARFLARKWPNVRVVSIGWGPWEMGMVTPQLKDFYEKNEIGLISPSMGAKRFMEEIACADTAPEIVVAAQGKGMSGKGLGLVIG